MMLGRLCVLAALLDVVSSAADAGEFFKDLSKLGEKFDLDFSNLFSKEDKAPSVGKKGEKPKKKATCASYFEENGSCQVIYNATALEVGVDLAITEQGENTFVSVPMPETIECPEKGCSFGTCCRATCTTWDQEPDYGAGTAFFFDGIEAFCEGFPSEVKCKPEFITCAIPPVLPVNPTLVTPCTVDECCCQGQFMPTP